MGNGWAIEAGRASTAVRGVRRREAGVWVVVKGKRRVRRTVLYARKPLARFRCCLPLLHHVLLSHIPAAIFHPLVHLRVVVVFRARSAHPFGGPVHGVCFYSMILL